MHGYGVFEGIAVGITDLKSGTGIMSFDMEP